MLKKILITIALGGLVLGCATSPQSESETQEGLRIEEISEAPVIIDYYAVKVIRPGDAWRVYLHAKDNDGDMKDIASVLEQEGDVPYGTCVSRVKNASEVVGYLFLKTPKDKYLLNDRFNLKVVVRDRQGNRSEVIEVPLRFSIVPPEEIPEDWVKVSDRRLGAASYEIMSTQKRSQRTRP